MVVKEKLWMSAVLFSDSANVVLFRFKSRKAMDWNGDISGILFQRRGRICLRLEIVTRSGTSPIM